MKLDGKVVLITGASEGIGRCCAREFAASGAKVSMVARSEDGLRKAAPEGALITAADVTIEEDRRRAVERTIERFGRVDVLINNAGIGLYGPSWMAPMEDARRLMELNFFAVLGMAQLVAPHMRARRSGMIVNVSSIGGKMTLPWMTLYSASKYAVGSLTEGMRMELRRDDVQTMLVCPGFVKTGFQQHVIGGKSPEGVGKARRFAITPEECARAIRRGVERGARTVMPPRTGWFIVMLARLFPSVMEARLSSINGTA